MAPGVLPEANGFLHDDQLPSTEVSSRASRKVCEVSDSLSWNLKPRNLSLQDLLYEEELLRNPFSLRMW